MTDLILTQTLGPELLWHLVVNMALGKVYVISLLYTLNSINEYRVREQGSQEVYSHGNERNSRRTNMELTPRSLGVKADQIFVQTQVSTHISPLPKDKTEYISGGHGFENDEDHSASETSARFAQ
ncbi:hypothetical protein K438DRAFT_1875279 [Mycena galopus ATCC 62051]|nr:hypothetical protein K438DRAFT_1875279 [Mycena galopus ATCC 62051]